MNLLVALEALSNLLTLIGAGAAASMQINAVITKARAENRDISDEELNSIIELRHSIEDRLLSKLTAAETT